MSHLTIVVFEVKVFEVIDETVTVEKVIPGEKVINCDTAVTSLVIDPGNSARVRKLLTINCRQNMAVHRARVR